MAPGTAAWPVTPPERQAADDVGALGHLGDQVGGARLAEVDRDAALVPVDGEEGDALAIMVGCSVAIEVAVGQRLDLDDVGAEVAEDGRADRSSQEPAHIDDANALERKHDPLLERR